MPADDRCPVYALAFLDGPAGLIPLIGKGNAMHAANALAAPDLSQPDGLLAYMRLF